MNSREVREKFLDFFRRKNHKIIPSVPLLPPDKTVLFTTAGMQPLTPYLAGIKDPLLDFGTRHLASCQKCFRTNDIDEVGDDTHHTFFEMLGNWSIGTDEKGFYFKEGAIQLALEFLLEELRLDLNKISITFFEGTDKVPRDEETFYLWQKYGIKKEKIKPMPKEDNFWGPVGNEGPCGPCSEIYYQKENGKIVEIWNLVFMEYYQKPDGTLSKLSQTNIDTGIGFERLVSVLQKTDSAYETDLFRFLIQSLGSEEEYMAKKREFRIIADHIRASAFLIADGVFPSNIDQGYILRRLLRRVVRFMRLIDKKEDLIDLLFEKTIDYYKDVYLELAENKDRILEIALQEREKFSRVLTQGLNIFKNEVKKIKDQSSNTISGKFIFDLYQNFGFPPELTFEMAKEEGLLFDKKEFEKFLKEHQEVSRKSYQKKFGGHGLKELKDDNQAKKITKLHTATHLLHQALRQILGSQVSQQGSDITPERLRFDFSFPRKLTEDELKKVEDLVNQKIKEGLAVKKEKMKLEDALKSNALAFFKERYPEEVFVYTIGDFSKEICAGPHVENTAQLGRFKIIKEESVAKGIRRIRAILEE